MGAYLEQACHRKRMIFHVFCRCDRVPHLAFSLHLCRFSGVKKAKTCNFDACRLLSLFLRALGTRHSARLSAVAAECAPLSLIHSVNKSGLAWSTRSATNRMRKTASGQPMVNLEGGGKARRGGRGVRVSWETPPSKKTSSLLSFSFVPCCQ